MSNWITETTSTGNLSPIELAHQKTIEKVAQYAERQKKFARNFFYGGRSEQEILASVGKTDLPEAKVDQAQANRQQALCELNRLLEEYKNE